MSRIVAFTLFFCFLIAEMMTPAQAERRVAFVIGNATYAHAGTLKNPKNDAEAIAKSLTGFGFDVVAGIDLTYDAMQRKILDFAQRLKGADVALLYYSGHGLQVNGRNYLVPVDAQLNSENDLELATVPLTSILSRMGSSAKTNLVFLDACRNNPLADNLAQSLGGTRSAKIGRGLARISIPDRRGLAGVSTGVGTLIAFATQPGNVAYDGDGENSPFTTGLLKHMGAPGLGVEEMMQRVRVEVMYQTEDTQVPWSNSSLTENFIFNDRPAEQGPDVNSVETAFWYAAEKTDTKKNYQLYLERYPAGAHAVEARTRFAALTLGYSSDIGRYLNSEMGAGELTLVLQSQLKRVGCDPGKLDGRWGQQGRSALGRFNKYAKLQLPTSNPTIDVIEAVKSKAGLVCPLVCGPRYNRNGEICVKKSCASGQYLTKSGNCAKSNKNVATRRKATGSAAANVPSACKSSACKSTAKHSDGRTVVITTTPVNQW